jgi:hypothetical protein
MQYVYMYKCHKLCVILAEGKSEHNFDPMPRSYETTPRSHGGCRG